MSTDQKVLACVDQSHYADCVADYATWAARQLGAPLEFLHILDRHPEIAHGNDHSGAIGFDAQEVLLGELSGEDEARSRAAREQGRIFLDRLRERAIANGANSPDVRQRHGTLQESLVERQANVLLYVLGRRGESARTTHRDLGRNVESVVRALQRSILTVGEPFSEPRRALIAFDGGVVTRRGVEMLARSSLLGGMNLKLLMSGKPRADAARQLEWARQMLQTAGFDVTAELVPGDAERIIASAVHEQQIDLLVMGAYAHSPLRALLFGSRTSDLLRSTKIPTLLLR